MAMTSNRPYLFRAFYEWIVDNDCTPYVVVDAYHADVSVPQSYVSDGQIVLNIAPRAVAELVMNNEAVAFSTRFGGVPTSIYLPVAAIMGIYARENGQGMVFQEEPSAETPRPKPVLAPASRQQPGKPSKPQSEADPKPVVKSIADDDSDKPTPPSGGGKRPSLKVIK